MEKVEGLGEHEAESPSVAVSKQVPTKTDEALQEHVQETRKAPEGMFILSGLLNLLSSSQPFPSTLY